MTISVSGSSASTGSRVITHNSWPCAMASFIVRYWKRSLASLICTPSNRGAFKVENSSNDRHSIFSSGLICVKNPPVRPAAIFMK